MADFPWLLWIMATVAIELFFVWFIRRAEGTGAIERHRWPFKSERLLDRAEDHEQFDHLIRGWRKLMYLVPFITFGVLYFGDY